MTSLTAIPFADIEEFLLANGQIIPENQLDTYKLAWNLILIVDSVPSSIADFLIALNLSTQDIKVPTYKLSQILLSSEEQLTELSNLLTLSTIERERIIRILKYLQVLVDDSNFIDTLPREVLKDIIMSLDCKSILSTCNISPSFNNLCQIDSDLLFKLGLCRMSMRMNIIAVGDNHTLLLTNEGHVYSCGQNYTGQLGLSDYISRETP